MPATRLRLWAVLFATLTMTACASIGTETPQELVRQRAAARWKAQVAGDFDHVYSYNTPDFRELVTSEKFSGSFGAKGSWLAGEVIDVDCQIATQCVVDIRIDLKPIFGNKYGDKISTVGKETWVLENGQWWIFQPIAGK